VTYGQIGFDLTGPANCYVTWVLSGATAPSDLSTAHPVPPPNNGTQTVLPISADEGIDVYVYAIDNATTVIVEV